MDIEKIQLLTDDQLVRAFRQTRTIIEQEEDKFKAAQKGIKELRDVLESEAIRRMNERDSTSFKTESGTCFKTTQASVTTKDKTAFFDWLNSTGRWELADVRPAKKEVQNFAEVTGGDLPPGVNMTQRIVAQFRAPSNK